MGVIQLVADRIGSRSFWLVDSSLASFRTLASSLQSISDSIGAADTPVMRVVGALLLLLPTFLSVDSIRLLLRLQPISAHLFFNFD